MPEDNVKVAFMEEQIKELKDQNKDFEKRLMTIEQSRAKTEYQYEQIMDAIKKLNDVTIPNLVRDLDNLKNKPAKRWESGVNALISAVVAALVGFGVTKLGGK